jgi:hypothetical protein
MVEDSTDQANNQHTTDTKRSGISWLIWTILLPLLYVLSIGPVGKHYEGQRPRLPPQALVAFYDPVNALARAFPPFASFMNWYFRLWVPLNITPATPPVSTAQTSNTATN